MAIPHRGQYFTVMVTVQSSDDFVPDIVRAIRVDSFGDPIGREYDSADYMLKTLSIPGLPKARSRLS